jgi:hypothetical protein
MHRTTALIQSVVVLAMSVATCREVELVARVGTESIGDFATKLDVIAREFANLEQPLH